MLNDNSKKASFYYLSAYLCLSIINVYLLSSSNKLLLAILLNTSFFILFIGLLFYWPEPFLPMLNLGSKMMIVKNYLTQKVFSFFEISKGRITSQYLLLREKPRNFFIQVDHKSAVLVADQNHNFFPLLQGIHFIDRNKKIVHIFNLDIQIVRLGPLDENPTLPPQKVRGESLVNHHLRNERAAQTKCITKDHQILYPSFLVVYQLNHLKNTSIPDADFIKLSLELANRNFSVEVTHDLRKIISDSVISKWNKMAGHMDLDTLTKLIGDTPTILNDLFETISVEDDNILNFFTITVFLEKIITN